MTTRYYHTPPPPVSTRVRCPVCHEAVYSRANIHPQCAVHQSERPEPKGKAKGVAGALVPDLEAIDQVEGVAVVGPPTAEGASAAGPLPATPDIMSPGSLT